LISNKDVFLQYYGSGGIFKGAFSKDYRNGWGVYYWPNKCFKYEGEWVGDDPICGNTINLDEEEYHTLVEMIPKWSTLKSLLPHPLPQKKIKVMDLHLNY
jgi:hypothetical protein